MSKILWISRHEILGIQKDTIISSDKEIIQIDKTITDYGEIIELLQRYNPNYIVANLPNYMWILVLKNPLSKKTTWLRTVMKIVHHPYKGCEEPCKLFNPYTDVILPTKEKRFSVDYPGRYSEDLHFSHISFERILLSKGYNREQIISIKWK